MKPTKLKAGQRVICTHYKDRPIVTVDCIIDQSRHISGYTGEEIWVTERRTFKDGNFYTKSWWGPRDWFRALPKKQKISKVERYVPADPNNYKDYVK